MADPFCEVSMENDDEILITIDEGVGGISYNGLVEQAVTGITDVCIALDAADGYSVLLQMNASLWSRERGVEVAVREDIYSD